MIVNYEIPLIWEDSPDQKQIYVEQLPPLPPRRMYAFLKRTFDILMSSVALILLVVPMSIIALVIVIDSPGNPIYTQKRLGLREKPFRILKFRSMVIDAEAEGLRWAEVDDPRVTRIGKILRRTRLDELPQLINILLGQMSFVGPRPERPEFYSIFDTYIIGFRQRMLVIPGLTGWAQVKGGYDLRPEEKILYDIAYIKRRSLWMDLICIAKTVYVIITGKGTR